MLERLPDFIDPIVFADRQRQLSGEIALNRLTRLKDVLCGDSGAVRVDLSFSKQGRLAIIRGTAAATLKVECQSCLQPMDWPLEIEINLAAVTSLEQADLLAGEHEPLLLEEEKISLNLLVEDEMLLALPDFLRHEQDCMNHQAAVAKDEPKDDETAQPDSNNPFSVLAQLKNTGDK